ncbi:MAG TPA: hypothetical protein VFA68_10020 [Terriglobales bacterium]|nr:hypothetical protein [Terriglobales bacterium]
MPEMRDTRQKVKITLVVLLVVDIVAAALLYSPLIGSERSRTEQLKALEIEMRLKTRAVQPLRGLPEKIVLAREQIGKFYKDRLPSQESSVSETMGKLATDNGVKIGQVRYKLGEDEQVGLRPIYIEAEFSGGYLQLVRFVNAIERDKLFFLIDSVDLGGEQSGVVKLQMKLETYLKAGA